ncbi:MAG: hypothetical protein J0H99_07580 [Rhodospirillales bacterium]|nr:hypothetical protein [Rhodospirillales bacterium]
MVRFGTPQSKSASEQTSLGRPAAERFGGASSAPFGLRPARRPEPIRAARGVTFGIMLSLPVWAGAVALVWATL